jgi:hypothetical protein
MALFVAPGQNRRERILEIDLEPERVDRQQIRDVGALDLRGARDLEPERTDDRLGVVVVDANPVAAGHVAGERPQIAEHAAAAERLDRHRRIGDGLITEQIGLFGVAELLEVDGVEDPERGRRLHGALDLAGDAIAAAAEHELLEHAANDLDRVAEQRRAGVDGLARGVPRHHRVTHVERHLRKGRDRCRVDLEQRAASRASAAVGCADHVDAHRRLLNAIGRVGHPRAELRIEARHHLRPAVDLAPGGHRQLVVDVDERRDIGEVLDDLIIHPAPPDQRHAERDLVLRDPAEVGGLDRHLAVIDDDQINVGQEHPEVPRVRRNDVELVVDESL